MEKITVKGIQFDFSIKVDELNLDGLNQVQLANLQVELMTIKNSIENIKNNIQSSNDFKNERLNDLTNNYSK